MQYISKYLLLLVLFFATIGCNSRENFKQTYLAALSIGDLIEVTVDTKKLTYSYKVLEGDLKDQKGNGVLTPYESINKYAYKIETGHTAVFIKDEVAIGAIGEDFYVGVPKRDTPINLRDIAGIYNYVSYSPRGVQKNINDKTSYGTLEFKEDNTWSLLAQDNLANPASEITMAGNFKYNGRGMLEIFSNGNKMANVMIRSGDHFVVLDIVNEDFKGIGFAQKQANVSSNDLPTTFSALLTHEEPVKGSIHHHQLITEEEGKKINYDLTFNAPWMGLIKGKSEFLEGYGYYDFFGIASRRSDAVYGVLQFFDKDNNYSAVLNSQGFIAIAD